MTKKKILLVDDEPRVTRLLRMHIEDTGAYEVKEVNQGSMALNVARQFNPDFILLDVVMPDMDGGEVAAQLAADTRLKNTPVVFLTATVAKGEEGVIAGYPFLAKPATGEQILECIQQYLGAIPHEPAAPIAMPSEPPMPRHMMIGTLVLMIMGAGFFGYWQLSKSEESQRATVQELQKTRTQLSTYQSSAAKAIKMQQQTITDQEKTLDEQTASLKRMKAIESRLEEALMNMEQTRIARLESSGVSPSLLNSLAPSVVKVYCLTNSYSDNVQQGTGFLFRASNRRPTLPLYYVQTNLHVIAMTDRPNSECRILLHPDYSDGKTYLLFKSRGYKSYGKDIDLAFLEPEIVRNDLRGGTVNDLVVYARDESDLPACDRVDMGDHLSILGYPGIGGETLTVTEGIVSGFELDGKNRYIKTSAKTDHGNSGGVAIQDSGCLVGVPTWSRRGKVESMGRVLDIGYLRNEMSKYVTLQ